ncbi:LysM peptidoglycan-binding domain-containing protein [Mesobacillus maritimus]|uniref:LysM peptidoglycan-binding domain-containing protein n=1 Tax=Mesobacillus maritimus TaxID=1643336 RepID=A0ABS7K2M7_9BACI|nr:LysM peptidoglycan-binding domain-containing protein [Mesobacillus maritimus]MBY0096517.1 LysM peptidoglycan-binding domain-containing protein [Mesobacillus maritimus]
MNKEAPYRDQAERTRKKIVRTKGNNTSPEMEELPPRSKLHRQKKNKNKWKLKYPVIRLLAVFFILLPISIFSAYSYLNNKGGDGENGSMKTGGYEKINIEKNNSTTETSLPVRFEEKDIEAEGKAPVEPAPLAEDSVPSPADNKNPPALTPKTQVATKVTPVEPEESQESQESQDLVPNQGQEISEPNSEEATTDEKIVYHTVKEGDNLFRISLAYYNSQHGMERIRQANNLQGDEVQLGQVLKIPLEN